MRKKGFTFIEVLVVTTIIAILTAVGMANFRVANQKARDGKRKGDLEQIRAALELYRTDESEYPSSDIIAADSIESADSTYMSNVPEDPSSDYTYFYTSNGTVFSLCAALEVETTGSCTAAGASCGTGVCNYQVNSPD